MSTEHATVRRGRVPMRLGLAAVLALAALGAGCGDAVCVRNSDCAPPLTCSPTGTCTDGLDPGPDAAAVDAGEVDATTLDAGPDATDAYVPPRDLGTAPPIVDTLAQEVDAATDAYVPPRDLGTAPPIVDTVAQEVDAATDAYVSPRDLGTVPPIIDTLDQAIDAAVVPPPTDAPPWHPVEDLDSPPLTRAP